MRPRRYRPAPGRACGAPPRPSRGSPESVLDALIREQAACDVDHDRTARTLSAYAKTLTIAQSLLDQEGTAPHEPEADDHQPRSLNDLRDELASHLERLVAEEEARGSDGLLV